MFEKIRNTTPDYQDFFKFIAVIAMVLDHIGLFFIDNSWLRLVGRFAMPVFCFFAGYNYYHVKQKTKILYCLQQERYRVVLTLGIAAQVIIYIWLPLLSTLNIILTIVISLLLIDIITLIRLPLILAHLIMLAFSISTYSLYDYGTVGTAFVYLGFMEASSYRNIIYGLLLASWLIVLAFIESSVMYFTSVQNILLLVICAIHFWIFYFADPSIRINNRVVLISRYILPIYFWHFIVFVMIASFNNYT